MPEEIPQMKAPEQTPVQPQKVETQKPVAAPADEDDYQLEDVSIVEDLTQQ